MNEQAPSNCPRCGTDLKGRTTCRKCIWPVKPWTRHHFNIRIWWPLKTHQRNLKAKLRRKGLKGGGE